MEFETCSVNEGENIAFGYQAIKQYTTMEDLGLHSVGKHMDCHVILQNTFENNLASNIANVDYLQIGSPDALRTNLEHISNIFLDNLFIWNLFSRDQVCQTRVGGAAISAAGAVTKQSSHRFEHTWTWRGFQSVYTCRSWPPVHMRDVGIAYVGAQYNTSSPTTTRCYKSTTKSIQTPYRRQS